MRKNLALAAAWMLLPAQLIAGSFRADKLSEMDAAINDAIAQHRCPGGVLWLEHNGEVYKKAYGSRAVVPTSEPMTEDTIFDAASLTKVVATTPAVLLLAERGLVKLDEPVCSYIPEFKGEGRELVTIRQLMTHTSGLREDIETKTDWHGQAEAIKKTCAEKLRTPPARVSNIVTSISFSSAKSCSGSATRRWKFLCNAKFMGR